MSDTDYDIPLKPTLYKYTSFKSAFSILTSNKIYFAKLSEFNDPFDGLMALDLSTIEKRKDFLEHWKKTTLDSGGKWRMKENNEQEFINNQDKADRTARVVADSVLKKDSRGFCCLTDTYESLPMWGHYANDHTGCCLVFDFSKYLDQSEEDRFPFHHMKKIAYQEDLPTHGVSRPWHYYAHKSLEWEYEQEWRAIMFNQPTAFSPFLAKSANGSGLYQLGDFLCGVILGDKMKEDDKEAIKAAVRQRGISLQYASRELYKYGIRLTWVDAKRLNQK